ncbi:MAG: hypothetical protein KF729_10815 [Sandaracinaceae bacterium]|nr:hypothetical protein [Sandaracinaceae bacterium]
MSDVIPRLARLCPALLFVFALACGGGASEPATEAEPAATAGEEDSDPTEGGRRRAARGARCDHGGAADFTCQRGLFCCYQDAPSAESGTCVPVDDCSG